jgi:protein involved in polysaccharide export with SLBB domain
MPGYEPKAPQTCELSQLKELWQRREGQNHEELRIGPGDVITVSVPELDELQRQKVRVASDGTIGLSLIGTMQVAGMDEDQLRAALVSRLAKFMKFPRVDLFVKRYQAREVAVTGAVQKPGTYTLADMNQSILDMIGQAGGMTSDAAQKVIFVPAGARLRPADVNDSKRSLRQPSLRALGVGTYQSAALEETVPQLRDSDGAARLTGGHWIVINLENSQSHACLGIPTRPGDVIIVPIAGEVMVQGWVNKPGAFTITPRMTVLGAVSAAGGASFSTTAELIRTDSTGKHVITQFNLTDLTNGAENDPAVQSGDVVIVEPSLVGAIPYTFLQIINHFGSGLYFPAP